MVKRGFMDGYRTYDAEREGYGSSWLWRESFRERMGMDEAREVLQDTGPLAVLELPTGATWNEIKRAYRALTMKFHPDHCNVRGISEAEATERMKEINAAFTLLEHQHGHCVNEKGLR